LKKVIADHTDEIEKLNGKVNDLKKDNDKLNDYLAKMEKENDKLQKQVKAAEGANPVSDLTSQNMVVMLQGENSKLTKENEDMRDEVEMLSHQNQ
jgi:predicted RNase H-like nuclease (RuvC/YqgF family)